METKKCSKCGRELPLTEFNRRAASPDGLQHWCKDCVRESQKGNTTRSILDAIGGYSDPDFDGKQPVEVIQLMSRAKRWLESRGYTITLKGEYREVEVRQVKFQ